MVCGPSNAAFDTSAAGIEVDNSANARLFEGDGFDIHAAENGKNGSLDVKSGEGFVGQWFEPLFECGKDVLVKGNEFEM